VHRVIRAYGKHATKAGIEGRWRLRIHIPRIMLTRAQIIRAVLDLGVDYGMIVTC